MSSVLDRFVKYVQIPTQADSGTAEVPQHTGQMTLARELVEELKAIGLRTPPWTSGPT